MAREELQRLFLQRELPYIKPFFAIDYHNDDEILTWIRETDNSLLGYYAPLFREQKNNLKIFLNTGINPNFFSPMVAVFLQQGLVGDQPDEININEMYRLVMDKTSMIVSNELTSQVLPNNEDYNDKIAAKFVKKWLESMSYDLDIDIQRIRWEIQKVVFGESFVVPIWDPDGGELHPMLKGIEDFGDEEIPLLDDEGKKVRDESGKVVKISRYQRIGDIDLINPLPFDVMIDPKNRYKDANWFYYVEYVDTEELSRKYPDDEFKKDKISKYDPEVGFDKTSNNHTKVYHFWHRAHEFLPTGRHLICTSNRVLFNETLERNRTLIESKKLPLVRFTDLDMGYGVRGTPITFRNGRPVVGGYNRLSNQIYYNLEAESPRIMVHETAGVDARRMPNGVSVIEWRGNYKPTIETPSTNTSGIFKYREDLKKNILEMGGQTPMVRGDTPNAQLDSFIALQHFEDQRVQLATPEIKGHIKNIEHLYKLMIMIATDNYDVDDGRLIKIMGKNNKFNLQYFDPENLSKVYDVKITTTGNLANSKAARTQLIMTIKREFPNTISDEMFIDSLGLSTLEQFQNAITAAVNTAESENEDMLNGIPVEPPERFEDLITHWDSHRIPMQSREFKMSPPEVRDLFERHVTATEKLMYEQAADSESFAMRLAALKQFPLFFSAIPTNAPPQEEAAVQEAEQSQIPDETIQVDQEPDQIIDREESQELGEGLGGEFAI